MLNVLHCHVVISLSSEIKLKGGLKNNTMHSYMPVSSSLKKWQQIVITVSIEFCVISSICSIEL